MEPVVNLACALKYVPVCGILKKTH